MKLHHFCRASDLESIAEKGLYPHVPKESAMSLGQEVVWLTSTETMEATKEDLEHFRNQGWPEEEVEKVRQHGVPLNHGRTHCLTVRVRSDHKLINYGAFLRRHADTVILNEDGFAHANDAGELYSVRHMAQGLSPRALRTWWVYFERIPPSAIEGLPEVNKPKKKKRLAEDSALEAALSKFVRAETTGWAP